MIVCLIGGFLGGLTAWLTISLGSLWLAWHFTKDD